MGRRYTVSDGRLVLRLESAEAGGYVVTSPLDPQLITQAETLDEAFSNARDAARACPVTKESGPRPPPPPDPLLNRSRR